VWLKEQKDENLSEDDRKRVAERNRKNADVFGAETMDEGMCVRECVCCLRGCLPTSKVLTICSTVGKRSESPQHIQISSVCASTSRHSSPVSTHYLHRQWIFLCSGSITIHRCVHACVVRACVCVHVCYLTAAVSRAVSNNTYSCAELGKSKQVAMRQRVISTSIVYLSR